MMDTLFSRTDGQGHFDVEIDTVRTSVDPFSHETHLATTYTRQWFDFLPIKEKLPVYVDCRLRPGESEESHRVLTIYLGKNAVAAAKGGEDIPQALLKPGYGSVVNIDYSNDTVDVTRVMIDPKTEQKEAVTGPIQWSEIDSLKDVLKAVWVKYDRKTLAQMRDGEGTPEAVSGRKRYLDSVQATTSFNNESRVNKLTQLEGILERGAAATSSLEFQLAQKSENTEVAIEDGLMAPEDRDTLLSPLRTEIQNLQENTRRAWKLAVEGAISYAKKEEREVKDEL